MISNKEVVVDVRTLYDNSAKLNELPLYVQKGKEIAGEGNVAILTGEGPIWLYLKIAHALHGKARRLVYRSPVTGDVVIFDHDPF